VLAAGYNEDQMEDTLQKYIDLNLIMQDEKTITLLEWSEFIFDFNYS